MRHRIGISLLSAAMVSGCTINIVPAQNSGVTPTRVVHAPAPATTTRITQTYQSQTVTQTSLYLLVVRGDQAAVSQQLQQGADPNQFGDDPAHGPRTPLCVAVRNRNYTLTRMLLDAGANPNLSCHYQGSQETPLLAAASLGNAWLVTQLLNKGADPHYRNPNGQTPYLLASQGHHRSVMDKLVAAGVTPAADNQNATAPAQAATDTQADQRDDNRQHKPDKQDRQDKADKRNARDQRDHDVSQSDNTPDGKHGGKDHSVTPAASASGQAHASAQSRLHRDDVDAAANDDTTTTDRDPTPAVTAKPSWGQHKETATYAKPAATAPAHSSNEKHGKPDTSSAPMPTQRAASNSSAAAARVSETPAATVVTAPGTGEPEKSAETAQPASKADKQKKDKADASDEPEKKNKKDKGDRD